MMTAERKHMSREAFEFRFPSHDCSNSPSYSLLVAPRGATVEILGSNGVETGVRAIVGVSEVVEIGTGRKINRKQSCRIVSLG